MTLKDFWKRSVIKLILCYALLFFAAWLLGPNSPLPPAPEEVGAVWFDNHAHGSGSYHDPYQYRLRI